MSDSLNCNRSNKSLFKTRIDLKKEDFNEEIQSTDFTIRNHKANLDAEALNEKLKLCVVRRSPSNRKNSSYLIRNSKVFEQDQICDSSDSGDYNESETMLASYNFVQNKNQKESHEATKISQKSALLCPKSVDFEKTSEHELSSEDSLSKKSVTFIVNNLPDHETEEDRDEIGEPNQPSSSWSKIKCTSLSEMKFGQEGQLRNQSSKSLISLLKIEAPTETEISTEPEKHEICQIDINNLNKTNELVDRETTSDPNEIKENDEEQELMESFGELNKMSTLKLNQLANSRYLNEKSRNEINNLIKNKSCFLRRVSSFPNRTLTKHQYSNPLYDVKSKIEQFEKIKNDSSASTNYFVRGKYSRNSSQTGLMKTKISFQAPFSPNGTIKKTAKHKLPDLEEVCSLIKVKDLKSIFEPNLVKA